jgi:chromate transporter
MTTGRTQSLPILETARVFLRLGCTSFGGPIAHLGYFQNELVQRRRWVSEAVYADVVALCQFLPGPASSQVCFVLGYLRSGLLGGLLGWMAFTAPSAILMIAFAYGVHQLNVSTSGWLAGLKVAAVAVVAQAAWTMTTRLCPDWIRRILMAVCAALLMNFHLPWLQPIAIAFGALAGLAFLRKGTVPHAEILPRDLLLPRRVAAVCLFLFAALLALSLTWPDGNGLASLLARFYRTGALVFGGGHVVLPLLQSETVSSGLVPHDIFLSGYGAAQALPGPLFTFAAFLGASMPSALPSWFLGLWCLAGILLPSLLLILGVLPFWALVIDDVRARAAMMGANAAVVGLLVAALFDSVWKGGITSWPAFALVIVAFALLQFRKTPNWAIVIACAVVGEIAL